MQLQKSLVLLFLDVADAGMPVGLQWFSISCHIKHHVIHKKIGWIR